MSPEETPAERLMRQWYAAKLGDWLRQSAEMSLDRQLLRRGVRKMQDGELWSPSDAGDDDVNIRVGDEIHHHATGTVAEAAGAAKQGLLAKALPLLLVAALGASGTGIPLGMALLAKLGADQVVDTDTDTQYILEVVDD